jgi:hypothetical protein
VLFALVSNIEPGSRGWELLWEKRILDHLMYVFAKGLEKEKEADQPSRNRKVTRGMKRGNQVRKRIYLLEPFGSTKEMAILPRQARDKHGGESTHKKECWLLVAFSGLQSGDAHARPHSAFRHPIPAQDRPTAAQRGEMRKHKRSF